MMAQHSYPSLLNSDAPQGPDTTSPSTPANLTATAVEPTKINLSWDASTDNIAVTGYKIYRDGGGTPIATVTGTTYQDTGLSPSTLYTYNVSAIDGASNESAQSSQASDNTDVPDISLPSTPANLTATAVSPYQINLSWDASTDDIGVTGYNIYRDGGAPIATVTTGTTYQDTGLSPSTLYTYKVSAIDAAQNVSSQSSPASDTTDPPDTTPPSTPANLTATVVSDSQIDLSWDASTDNVGVTGYNIYRDGGGTPIATVTGTTYQDTGLSWSTLYTYKVSAIDAAPNESAQSSQASATTSGWYDNAWQYRRSITIDHTKVDNVATPSTTYADFPVLVYCTGLADINANGTDIRFTTSDGVTEIPREIESYASGTLYAWVKFTLTKDSGDSTDDSIYMYYGNSGASEPAIDSTYGAENVGIAITRWFFI